MPESKKTTKKPVKKDDEAKGNEAKGNEAKGNEANPLETFTALRDEMNAKLEGQEKLIASLNDAIELLQGQLADADKAFQLEKSIESSGGEAVASGVAVSSSEGGDPLFDIAMKFYMHWVDPKHVMDVRNYQVPAMKSVFAAKVLLATYPLGKALFTDDMLGKNYVREIGPLVNEAVRAMQQHLAEMPSEDSGDTEDTSADE